MSIYSQTSRIALTIATCVLCSQQAEAFNSGQPNNLITGRLFGSSLCDATFTAGKNNMRSGSDFAATNVTSTFNSSFAAINQRYSTVFTFENLSGSTNSVTNCFVGNSPTITIGGDGTDFSSTGFMDVVVSGTLNSGVVGIGELTGIPTGVPLTITTKLTGGVLGNPTPSISWELTNVAPTANAGSDQAVNEEVVVTLDGTASSDPDMDNLTYAWTQTSGLAVTLSNATTASPTFAAPTLATNTPVVLTFDLIVNDGTLDSVVDSVTITVNNINGAPLANAGPDQENIIPGTLVTLDGTSSSDSDADAVTYQWTQISGAPVTLSDNTASAPTFTAPLESSGAPLVFELIVNDGFVDSEPDLVSITVQDNVAVASKAIGEFLTARSALILAHQPDKQRRIDRLKGRSSDANRNSTIAGLSVPGSNKLPVSLTMNGSDVQMASSFSANGKDGKSGSIDIWGEAFLSDFAIDNKSGDFDIFYLGADYKLADKTLLGMVGQFDKFDYDNSVSTGVLGGDGWMVGPYVTHKLSSNFFLDARAAYGKSDNMVSPFGTYTDSFDTSRYLLAATLTGEYKLSDNLMLRPEGGITHLSENQESYVDTLGSTVPDQTLNQGQVHLAPRILLNVESGSRWKFRPYAEARGVLSYGDNVQAVLQNDTRLRLEGGVDLISAKGFRASAAYYKDGIGADGFNTDGWRLSVSFTPTGN